jgi:hypothetical protein
MINMSKTCEEGDKIRATIPQWLAQNKDLPEEIEGTVLKITKKLDRDTGDYERKGILINIDPNLPKDGVWLPYKLLMIDLI